MPLRLDPSGSVFVVFRRPVGQFDPVVAATRDGQSILPGMPTPRRSPRYMPTPRAPGARAWQPGRYKLERPPARRSTPRQPGFRRPGNWLALGK